MIDTKKYTLEILNLQANNTLVGHLGIEITSVGENFIEGRMPVCIVEPFNQPDYFMVGLLLL